MSDSINLSLGRQVVKTEIKKSLLISVVLLSAVVLFTLILVGTNYIFTSRYDKLVADEAELQARIETQSAKKAKLLLLHERLSTASSIITARKNLNEKFAEVLAAAPDTLTVKSSAVAANLINMGFESSDLAALNEFLNALYSLEKDKSQITKVKVNSFGFNETVANYVMDVDFNF